MRLIASPDGRNGSGTIHQNALIYATILNEGQDLSLSIAQGRAIWLQLMRGQLKVNGTDLRNGDAIALENETLLSMLSLEDNSEFLIFDLPQ